MIVSQGMVIVTAEEDTMNEQFSIAYLSKNNFLEEGYECFETTLKGSSLVEIFGKVTKPKLILFLRDDNVTINDFTPFLTADAALQYSNFIDESGEHPLIDYQTGSVRDDFDFGSFVVLNVEKAREVLKKYPTLLPDSASAWYALRLALTELEIPLHHKVYCYEVRPKEKIDSEKAHFAYVDPKNAVVQKEREEIFTAFAKRQGFYLPEVTIKENLNFECANEASIIIPVRNRVKTIADAVKSALTQRASFKFNVIVVDNHSTDGTTELLRDLSKQYSNLKHVIPNRNDLGIGGCWNEALNDAECGKFAVQLDSDDIYIDENTLQTIVDKFYETASAAVIGSYKIVDMNLNDLPPGLINHKEWTAENGHNNGLRINGFGAPRAFLTKVAREIQFPNVSYGEDYAMVLAITRSHQLSRIYEPLYLCRRWEGNSDAKPTLDKLNGFNTYKDGIRTAEIETRKRI